MHINEQTYPIEEGWSGELQGPNELYRIKGNPQLPSVSLGKPNWWADATILGDKWHPPSGGQRYGVVRFAFSLRPESPQVIKSATFTAHLLITGSGSNPTAYDLYPRELNETRKGEAKIALGPNFTFGEATASVGSAQMTFDTSRAVPVITADGLGEQTIRWQFQSQRSHPLAGSRIVYAVVELPPHTPSLRVVLSLDARIQTGGLEGLISGFLTREEQDKRSWVLGQS